VTGPIGPGRVVPVFAVTGKRTRPAGVELPLETLVTTTPVGERSVELQREHARIVAAARRPVSIVELGALLAVPAAVARVLVGDLAEAGYVRVHPPTQDRTGAPEPAALDRLVEGLRALAR
jgi:hypothetical protein